MIRKLLSHLRTPLAGAGVALLLSSGSAQAQALTNYIAPNGAFAASAGTFTALSGGATPTVTGTTDDGYYASAPIGFPFIYNGRAYSTFSASTNGFLALGGSLTNAAVTNSLSSGGSVRPVIAPLWDDLNLPATSNFTYLTTGTAPNRVLTAEWLNAKWNANATNSVVSFQARLYEADGKVEFVYRQETTNVNLGSASIGITAVGTGSGNFLSLNGAGTSPTVSSTSETTSISTRPATGQTYSFTPPATVPAAPTTLAFSVVSYSSMTVSFVDNSTNETGFAVLISTDGGTTYTVAANPASTTSAGTGTTYNVPLTGLTPAQTYTVKIQAIAEGRGSAGLTGTQATLAPVVFNGTPYTIDNSQPTSGTNFNNFTDAFTTLNAGSITASTTISVKYNSATPVYNEAPLTLTQTATSGATLAFVSSAGNAANPVVQGTGGTGSTDAVMTLSGSDYITFSGIDLKENAGNTTDAQRMEYGLFLTAPTGTNGCQSVTFQNATISLNSSNANGTTGVYALSSAATAASGAHSNLSLLNLTVQNARVGYNIVGASAAPGANNQIATSGAGTSTVKSLAGGSAAVAGVQYAYQTGFQVLNTTFQDFSTSGTCYGITCTVGGSTNTVTFSSNRFSNIQTSGANNVAAIYLTAGGTAQVNGNTVSPLGAATVSVGAANTGAAVFGMYFASAGTVNIYDNAINNVRQTATGTGGAGVTGLNITGLGTYTVYRNALHTITQASGSGNFVSGIIIGGTTCLLYNNLLSNLRYDGNNSSMGMRAINITGGTTISVYYNTVYLNGASTTVGPQSAALYLASTSTTTLDFRNNILYNGYVAGSGGGSPRNVAVYKSSNTVNNPIIATTSNNNLVYGSSGIYAVATNSGTGFGPAGLASYRALLNSADSGTRESAAVTETTTPFVSATDPHLLTSVPTQAESGAQRLTGGAQSAVAVPDDYDAALRQGETGYAGTSTTGPDIGADEGEFSPSDLTPPVITYTPIANTNSTANQTLAATITDASGIGTGAGAPLVYYRKGTSGAYFSAVATGVSGNQYTFTIDYANLGGVSGGDVINYYVAAQDASPNANVATSPAGGSGATPPGSTAPASPNSYSILQSFSGTLNVGPTETISSLTAANGLFARLNAGVLTGDLTVLITGDLNAEDGATALNPPTEQPLSSGYTIRIQPSAATLRTVSGWAAQATAANGITLNGADRIVFDGRYDQTGTDKFLLFRNANSSGSAFVLAQDATNNVIRNVITETQGSTSTGGITFGTSSTTPVNGVAGGVTGNDFNQVLNCDIRDRSDVATAQPAQGVYSGITGAIATNSNNTIQGCNIFNFTFQGVGLANGTGGDWTISGNSFYNTGRTAVTTSTGLSVIAIRGASTATGTVVSGNYVGGSAPLAGGAAWANTATSATIRGIYLNGAGTTNTPATTISGNFVQNFAITGGTTGTGTFTGIEVSTSTLDNTSYSVSGNTVSDVSSNSTQSNGLGTTGLVGIAATSNATSSTAQVVTGNTVYNLNLAPATLSTANIYVTGIATRSSSTATGTLSRNRVYNLTNAGTATTAGIIGIGLNGGAWTTSNNQVALSNTSATVTSPTNGPVIIGIANNVSLVATTEYMYFNSVRIAGTASGALKTYAFRHMGTASSLLRNNILVNERAGGTGSHFAIGTGSAVTVGTTTAAAVNSNYNDLFSSNSATLGENNTTPYAFAGWQAHSSAPDVNSKNRPVKFIDPAVGNLNLDATTNCSLDNAGQALATVDGEYDNAATSRQTTPDLGSDEFAPVQQTATIVTPGPVCGPTTASVTLTGNGGPYSVTYSDGSASTTASGVTSPFTFPAAAGKTYTLTSVTDTYGCSLATAGSLTVNPKPTAALTSPNQTLCLGSSATVNTTLTGTPPFTLTVTATDAGGTTSQTTTVPQASYSLSYPIAQNTTFAITALTDANGCSADVNTLPSIAFTVVTTTTYTGAAPGDGQNWFNAANWTACVPSNTIDALIPGGLNFYPSLNTSATAAVRTLSIASGASLVQSAGTLNVYGDLTNNAPAANVSLTGGMVAFRGAAPTVTGIDGFYDLNVNLTAAAGVLALANDISVTHALTMTQGVLNTGAFALTLAPAATLSETDASYVLGQVAVPGRDLSTATAESFGNIGLTLTPDAASTAFPGLTTVVRTTGTVLTGAGTSQSIKRYFDIQPATNTGLNVAMDFSYFDHERNGIAPGNVALFKSVSGLSGPWANQAPITIAGNTVSKTGIADFSIWTLGSATNPLPVELTAFTAERQGTNAALTWTTASEKNNAGFDVQVSPDGRAFRTLGFVASPSASSNAPRHYTFLDAEKGKAGLRYYRLRQLDVTGKAEFSPVRTVRFESEAAPALVLTGVPNPFEHGLTLRVELPAGTPTAAAQLRVTDAAGRVVLTTAPLLSAGLSQLPLDLRGQASGVYFVQLTFAGQPAQHLKVVKE
ncbi:T9SS type A sorting domain-containing protein [Hymenobacter sp. BT523]|uniref:fibronectin type III domain-containing protein n=1 Tax=Hymenobacter sp. BT523 TaxID=2795725 RepID=UPI0018EBE1DC|nr:T9SS type A sorting domain-containing protein [Hymenobacter sp. BT523]MBJ6108847.1 T9SS type A sorting domain-containing protein [Hymenobacter sp. BT523]